MSNPLLQAAHRYVKTHTALAGTAMTPVPGLFLIGSTAPSELEHVLARPLVCVVLQGRKHVAIGKQGFTFRAGDSMIVASNVPTVSRISEASVAAPYLAIALDLDLAVIADLNVAMSDSKDRPEETPEDTDANLRDAMLRLVQLLDRPHSLHILQKQLVREIHHWLLLGKQGQEVRSLGYPESQVRRIACAVDLLRSEYTRPLPIERLAAAADMSRSAFHKHFRAITSLSPLQFQKQLRLIEARRLILSQGMTSSRAAFEVGYESVSQFTREYARMHGRPPIRDRKASASASSVSRETGRETK